MAERTVEHHTIAAQRRFGAAPARVYGAWIEPSGRDRWDVPGDGWEHVTEQRDVRVGGRDVIRFGPSGSLRFHSDTTYVDLVPDQRLVMTYTVAERDVVWSVSVLTVELRPDGGGTKMMVTEQAAFLDGHDSPANRRRGFDDMFAQLAVHLGEDPS